MNHLPAARRSAGLHFEPLFAACVLGFILTACGKAEFDGEPRPNGGASSGFGGSSALGVSGDNSSAGAGNDSSAGGSTGGTQAKGGAPSEGGASSTGGAPTARTECTSYPGIVRAFAREQTQNGGGPNGGPGPGSTDGGAGSLGPCEQCIAECSREVVDGCENHTDCVSRHCTCEGCEERLPGDNFCGCVQSCNASNDKACEQAWLDYAACVSTACADTCPAK